MIGFWSHGEYSNLFLKKIWRMIEKLSLENLFITIVSSREGRWTWSLKLDVSCMLTISLWVFQNGDLWNTVSCSQLAWAIRLHMHCSLLPIVHRIPNLLSKIEDNKAACRNKAAYCYSMLLSSLNTNIVAQLFTAWAYADAKLTVDIV